eukprot:4104166-Pleurochrysis_carterae.AAC.1
MNGPARRPIGAEKAGNNQMRPPSLPLPASPPQCATTQLRGRGAQIRGEYSNLTYNQIMETCMNDLHPFLCKDLWFETIENEVLTWTAETILQTTPIIKIIQC